MCVKPGENNNFPGGMCRSTANEPFSATAGAVINSSASGSARRERERNDAVGQAQTTFLERMA
jgi:hypothetical protein